MWAVVPLDGDANQQRGVKGIVLALDAQDVTRTLWTSEQFAQRDRLGLFAKFDAADGRGRQGVRRRRMATTSRAQISTAPTSPRSSRKNYYVAVYGLLPSDARRRSWSTRTATT